VAHLDERTPNCRGAPVLNGFLSRYCRGPHRARDFARRFQLVQQPRRFGFGHAEQVSDQLGIGLDVFGQPIKKGEDSIGCWRERRHGGV
jgi:hypothetical protein